MGKRIRGIFKFILTLIIVLLMLILNGCNNTKADKTSKDNIEKEYEYINQHFGYSITLPNTVIDRVEFQVQDNSTYIYSKKIVEEGTNGGIILFIHHIPKKDYPSREDFDNYNKNESPVNLVVIGETNSLYVCYSFASDVQYPPDNKALTEEYLDLVNEFTTKGFVFKSNVELSDESVVEKVLGYAKELSKNKLTIDKVEWLTLEDENRIKELGYDIDEDLPSGFMIHNENEELFQYQIKDNAKIEISETLGSPSLKSTDQKGLKSRILEWIQLSSDRGGMLVEIEVISGEVIRVTEQYTP